MLFATTDVIIDSQENHVNNHWVKDLWGIGYLQPQSTSHR